MQPRQRRHATQPRQPRHAISPALNRVNALPATATLPAVAADPATATLPAVAADPATATLPAVAADPATAMLPAVATDPATARLAAVATLLVVLVTLTAWQPATARRVRVTDHRQTTGGNGVDALIPRERREVAPGAVHLPDWLRPDTQRSLVADCRRWSRPGVNGEPGMRSTRLPGGGLMSVRTVCLGWHWYPYGYSRTVDRGDGSGPPVLAFPDRLAELGRRAVADAYGDPAAGARYSPDIALINYYDADARMGLHRDGDERSDEPVVSLSLGDDCLFRFGNTDNRGRPWTDLELCSGDLFVFGGASRWAFHGVPRIRPGTADPSIGLARGRLNITLRVSGLPVSTS